MGCVQQAVLEFDEAVQAPWRPRLVSVPLPEASTGRRRGPRPCRRARRAAAPRGWAPAPRRVPRRARPLRRAPRPLPAPGPGEAPGPAAAPRAAAGRRSSQRVRLTRRARRLAVVLALAGGVALGSWLGPLLTGANGGDLRLAGAEQRDRGDRRHAVVDRIVGGGRFRRPPGRRPDPAAQRAPERRHRARTGPPAAVTTSGGTPDRAAPDPVARRRATAIGPQPWPPTSSTLSVGAFTLCARSAAYGRHVSGAMENRAAVFTSQPQSVEVYQSGAWWPGELLGWRHDDAGTCQVWVRVVLGGVEESAWTDLATLRLPERHLSIAPGPTAAGAPATVASAGRGSARLRDVSAGIDLSSTVSLPMVRERSPNHPAGGRRRAPETGAMPAVAASGGQRRRPSPPAGATALRPTRGGTAPPTRGCSPS